MITRDEVVMRRVGVCIFVFFFNDTATTEIYTLSLHDALPIWKVSVELERRLRVGPRVATLGSPIDPSQEWRHAEIGRAHV